MAIALKNNSRISPATYNIPYVGNKVTLSVYFRVNAQPTNSTQIMSRGRLEIRATRTATDRFTLGVGADIVTPDGTKGVSATKANLAVGAVYHAIFVYDKDDPARRFFVVNASVTPLTLPAAGPGPMTNLQWLTYGSVGSDITIQRAFVLDGYAATDEDVFALANDVDAAPAVFAAGLASAPGVTGHYHSMAGVLGADVHRGDPGVSYAGNNNYSIAEPSRPDPLVDTVTYVEDMACRSDVVIERAYIGASGKTLTVIVADPTTGSRIRPAVTGLTAAPSIKIDDGPPIVLPTTVAAGAYSVPTAEAIIIALPVAIDPASSVTLNAPRGWFTPNVGFSPELTDHPVANYSGMPISDGLWPDAAPTRVGLNVSYGAAGKNNPMLIHRNRALTFSPANAPKWPDGTVRGDASDLVVTTAGSNGLDLVGGRGLSGLYTVRWDDHDPARPVTMSLTNNLYGPYPEVVEFRNDGDEMGRGKVRVFDIECKIRKTLTLRTDIDAAATTIPYLLTEPDHDNVTGGFLRLDDEYIRLGNSNRWVKGFINCIRGWNGTTPAPHAAGATITAGTISQGSSAILTITSDDPATTRYKNLAIYSPGAVELPSPPAKLSLPPPNNMEVDPTFERLIGPGIGCYRAMPGLPGSQFADIDEPEQLVRGSDPHYAKTDAPERFNVASVRPYDPVASPYFYPHAPFANSETYGAVLGAPIATSPPPGTIETITIANGRETPVLFGQVLWAGSEKMRVVKIPLTGDLYEVERGSEDTPTSPHPAGPITVGYRIPVTQTGQYRQADSETIHASEYLFDESLSSPLRFGRNISAAARMGWAGSDDCNISSRTTLALTAPLTAAATTLAVSTPTPGGWDRIARNLTLVIGSETLTVLSADSSAGTITVVSRPATAAAYPTGTMATTKSSGVLVQAYEGGARGYAKIVDYKSVILPTGAGRALLVGSDPDSGVLTHATAASVQEFNPATAKTAVDTHNFPFFSYEFAAATAARSPGAWHWVTVPLRASDACLREIAKATLAHFPAGRKVVFELCNENWNFGLFNATSSVTLSAACGLLGDSQEFPASRSQSAYDVFKQVFVEAGRGGECFHMICGQTGSDMLAICRRLGVDPDGTAVAPYLHLAATAESKAFWDVADNAQVCDLFTFQNYYAFDASYRGVATQLLKSIEDHYAATGKRVMPAHYEGGYERMLKRGTPGYVESIVINKRFRDILYDPAFYYADRDFYAAVGQIGRVKLHCMFDLNGSHENNYWGMFWAAGQLPGYGDGRPGDVDNRVLTFSNPIDATRGPDAENRSVRGQAFLDHQKAFFGDVSDSPLIILVGAGNFQDFG